MSVYEYVLEGGSGDGYEGHLAEMTNKLYWRIETTPYSLTVPSIVAPFWGTKDKIQTYVYTGLRNNLMIFRPERLDSE